MAVEVEVRSFISKEKYEELLKFFGEKGRLVNEDEQESYYFDSGEDLRIQRNKFFSKIWLKKGKLHEDCREEIELKLEREKFEEIEKLFLALGYKVEIKWFRKRHTFDWEGIKVMVDHTKGYGYILELEEMSEGGKEERVLVLERLKKKLAGLEIPLTPKEEFDRKYAYYKENWRRLVKGV